MNLNYLNALSERIDEELESPEPNYRRLFELFNEGKSEIYENLRGLMQKREKANITVDHIGLEASNPRGFMVGIIPGSLSKETQMKIDEYICQCPFIIMPYDLEAVIKKQQNLSQKYA